jgi:hypothetical protein
MRLDHPDLIAITAGKTLGPQAVLKEYHQREITDKGEENAWVVIPACYKLIQSVQSNWM